MSQLKNFRITYPSILVNNKNSKWNWCFFQINNRNNGMMSIDFELVFLLLTWIIFSSKI